MDGKQRFRKLFEPGRIGEMDLKNRIVLSGMLSYLGTEDGVVNEKQIAHQEIRGHVACTISAKYIITKMVCMT